jgi:hypothetical protein
LAQPTAVARLRDLALPVASVWQRELALPAASVPPHELAPAAASVSQSELVRPTALAPRLVSTPWALNPGTSPPCVWAPYASVTFARDLAGQIEPPWPSSSPAWLPFYLLSRVFVLA